MTYEEFEWHILRMSYEEQVERLRPSMLAYALGLPHDRVSAFLEQAAHNGVLEMDFTEDGMLEYFVPGIDRERPLPKPIWKEESAESSDGHDGGVDGGLVRTESSAGPDGVDGSVKTRGPIVSSHVPASLRDHIQSQYGGDDEHWGAAAEDGGMVVYDDSDLMPLRVESTDEAFCDPSRTMFMRQIRIYGSQSQQTIRDQVARLFQSFGYRVTDSTTDRMRFERGSVMFILALVPLFVLVVPLFVYLFLYAMGRSTIQQEPLELDVFFRRTEGKQPYWEIDLTFVGQHGVVLGAADQQVLNREIDSLREELKWALTGS